VTIISQNIIKYIQDKKLGKIKYKYGNVREDELIHANIIFSFEKLFLSKFQLIETINKIIVSIKIVRSKDIRKLFITSSFLLIYIKL
jgi:hypothetical protein